MTTTTTKTFQPSQYQLAVFDHIQNSRNNLIVKATAGSGKTTTIVEAAKLVKGQSLFLAFNKHIVEELKSKLPAHFQCKTVHGICYGILKRVVNFKDVNTRKYQDRAKVVAQDIILSAASQLEGVSQFKLSDEIVQLTKFCQLTLTNPGDRKAVEEMINRFSLDTLFAPLSIPVIKDVLTWGNTKCRKGNLDYNDMIYFPLVWGLNFPEYDNVFVDESQRPERESPQELI